MKPVLSSTVCALCLVTTSLAVAQSRATITGDGWACLDRDAMRPLYEARKTSDEGPPVMKPFASGLFERFRQKEWCRTIPLGTEVIVLEEDGPLVRVKEAYAERQPVWTSVEFLRRQ